MKLPGFSCSALFRLLLLATTVSIHCAWAAVSPQSLTIPTSERPVSVSLYAAEGDQPRPAVLILHGRQGLLAFPGAYQHYASSIAEQGMDAYLVRYYSDNDEAVVALAGRFDYNVRFRAWTRLIGEVATYVAGQKQSTGNVGLLGFSQGGKLAIATAAEFPKLGPLVILSARMPAPAMLRQEIAHLPALIVLHGQEDTVVPLTEAQLIVDKAKELGSAGKLVVYPRAEHNFGFEGDGEFSHDVRWRAAQFLREQFKQGRVRPRFRGRQ